MWLFLILVGVPILEIALFIQVGGEIGLWPTLAIVILTALAGTFLMRLQGLQALSKLQNSIETGGDPVGPIAHGALILVAGMLLLTPGFFTDAVGLLLLVPPIRDALIRRGASKMTVRAAGFTRSAQTRRAPGPERPIDAEYVVLEDDDDARPGDSGWTKR